MSRCLIAAVLVFSAASFAQTPAELVEWLNGHGAKLNSQNPTVDLVARAYSVSFDGSKAAIPPAELSKLKAFPKVKEVGLGNKSGSDAAVAEVVKALPELETLNVSFGGITDVAFVDIAKLTRLKELKAIDTKITAAAMTSINKLPLQRLDISKTAVGDAGLEAIKGTRITNLWFNDMKGVTAKGVAAIAAMPELTNLVIQFAEINGEVVELAKSKKLKEITLMSSKLDDVGGVELGKIKTLENLFIWSTKVTDKTMAAISTLPLKVLYVSNTPITDTGMKSLAKISTLETLWLDRTAVGDPGLAAFAKHANIRWVQGDETKITDASITPLLTMDKLATFTARKTTVTDAGLAKLKEKFPKGRFSR